MSLSLSPRVAAECYMALRSGVAVTSSCSLYQLSSLAQDHRCQLFPCISAPLFQGCSSVSLSAILGSYVSAVQDCDVNPEAAVFILMSSLHPLTGAGRVLSNSSAFRNFRHSPCLCRCLCILKSALYISAQKCFPQTTFDLLSFMTSELQMFMDSNSGYNPMN